ncbi:hypothetical protein LCGC14_2400520 [marine sediment metagenome]|uniref:Uncharacterized protein n=1 Tax=marine sediment metagenome TaxID=412755 RepID=A0A0F9E7V2_9ZZZZ
MDINIEEQEAKLRDEAQRIGEELANVQKAEAQIAQTKQGLINRALQNQGALDLLKGLVPAEPPSEEAK